MVGMRSWLILGLLGWLGLGLLRCVPVGVDEPSGELVVIGEGVGRDTVTTQEISSSQEDTSNEPVASDQANDAAEQESLPTEDSVAEGTLVDGSSVEGVVPEERASQEAAPLEASEDGGSSEVSVVEKNSPEAAEPMPEPTVERLAACRSADGKDLCDDGNACNGVERCEDRTGQCIAGKPMVCDDGDDCNGTETCDPKLGKCVAASSWVCPIAPSECNQTGGAGQPVAGRVVSFQPVGGFRLRDLEQWSSSEQIADQIAAHPSVAKVALSAVLQDLNRSGSKVSAINGVSCLARGYSWESGDNAVAYWYPQGLTGSASANSTGKVDGKSVLIASWYHKPEEDSSTTVNKGVRVSIVDSSNQAAWPYRHALLVEPMMSNGKPSYRPIEIHAGGMAWFGNYLYVADTSKGFRVFDLRRILRVQTDDNNAIGYVAAKDEYHGFGYRYVIPQVNLYTRCSGSCCVRFSFAFMAVSAQSPSLLSGEYTNVNTNARLHRWRLDPTSGKLVVKNRTAVATEILFPGVIKMQGAAIEGTRIWVSSSQPKNSSPTSPGSLYTGMIGGAIATYRYPYPPEDMHLSHTDDLLWSQTENPNSRYVYAIQHTRLGSACP
ncbi:hypothetical protein L6R29_23960 [Myxococcota bacterium]|nr:hypothetical protein [Myxococcota bacterium]